MNHIPDVDWHQEPLLSVIKGLVLNSDEAPDWKEICQQIVNGVPHCDWVGFYWLHPDRPRTLLLGEYVGEPTEHTEIPFGRGICGQVAESLQTYVSDDVSLESNYIACSVSVRSEIVVPILKNGQFYGQLDVDSHTPAAFSARHRYFLEELCRTIEARIQ